MPNVSAFTQALTQGNYGLAASSTPISPDTLTTNADGTTTVTHVSNGSTYSETFSAGGASNISVTTNGQVTSSDYDSNGQLISSATSGTGDSFTAGGNTISISGAQSLLSLGVGGYSLTDASGNTYTLSQTNDGSGQYRLTSSSGLINVTLDPRIVTDIQLGANVTIDTSLGDFVTINTQFGSGSFGFAGSSQTAFNSPSLVNIDQNYFQLGSPNGGLGVTYDIQPSGSLGAVISGFLGLSGASDFASLLNETGALLPSLTATIPTDAPVSVPTFSKTALGVAVTDLSTSAQTSPGLSGDGTAYAIANAIWDTASSLITEAGQGLTDLADVSASEIANALWRPFYENLMSYFNDVPAATDLFNSAPGSITLPTAPAVPISDLVPAAVDSNPTPSFTDPLLLDLTGGGIGVSSWIDSPVYFDTNVRPDASGKTTTTPDGLEHETAWMKPGTGMLVFEAGGVVAPITDITQTVSEFLNAGATPAQYADGLAALAALTQAGATAFTAQTALVDPNTGVSYWNEIMVWSDANGNGVSDAGEVVGLDSLGITSISLVGSGNLGESINGSSVTNRTTYTKSDGSVNQAAAVNFQNDSIGNIATTVGGGVVITSLSEGGPTQATTFVAQNPTAHSYTITNGKLVDQTTGAIVVASGITAVLSSTEGDTITVAASDTGTYWLGGGSGTDVLTGGGGTNVFLVNPDTVVHGGTGANSFNIAKVIGTQGVTIDMAADDLQEVIGGPGGDVINASGTTWNVFIQAGNGNNILIGGAASDAIAGGTGDDLIDLGSGGGVVHAGSGNDVIYGGSGTTAGKPNSDVIFAGPGNDVVTLGTDNAEVYDGTGTLTVIGKAGAFSVVGLHGSYADYSLTHNADGTLTVTNIDDMDGDGTVTMTNVTDLDFKDIAQVPVANTAGMPVNDELNTANAAQVTVNAAGQYVIAAATLLANDLDYAGNPLSIRQLLSSSGAAIARGSSGQVTGGTAALSADGTTITFTPSAGFGGVMSFRYDIADNQGHDGALVEQVGTANTAEMSATVYLNTPAQPTDTLFDSEWFLAAASVLPVWSDYSGAGVSVAVFDPSGNVDFSNPDLAANAGTSVRIDGTPGVEQLGTHATLVAGVIGAARDGDGAVGVAYGATIDSVALPSSGTLTLNNLLTWSDYDVVDNSWTFSPPFVDSFLANPSYRQAYVDAVAQGRGGLGTVLVFAGGNDRSGGRTAEDLNETNSLFGITVGGIDATADLGSLIPSGRPFSEPGASILVSAPANNITSDGIAFTNDYGQQFGADTQTAAGTSFATPIVAGVAALMLEANPALGYRDIQQILAYSADLVNDPTSTAIDPDNVWSSNGATNWNGGGLHYSLDYGFGEVDARAAVRLAETWQKQQTYANLAQSAVETPSVAQLPVSVTPNFIINPDGTLGFGSYSYQYGYFSVAPGVSGETLEHVLVSVDLDLTDIALANTEIVLGRLASRTPYSLWGNVDAPIYSLTDTSVLLSGETASPGDVITESDGHQHLVFSYDTVQYMGEKSDAPQGWALEIIDTATGQPYVFSPPNWTIQFDGGASSSPQQWIFTDGIAAGSTIVPVSNGDSFNAAAATGNDVVDLRAGSTDSRVDGYGIGVGTSGALTSGFGGDGNDTVIGNDLGDILSGGRGTNTVIGGAGNDTILSFGGADTIDGGGGVNTLSFAQATQGVGMAAGGTADAQGDWEITAGYAAGTRFRNIQNITGSAYDDVLAGTSGNNALDGNGGNDTLIGGGGADSYLFDADYGRDVIVNGVAANGGPSGTLRLGAGLDPSKLWFAQVGNDLVIEVLGTSSQVTVQGWFANGWSQLAALQMADGSSIGTAAISGLVAAMGVYQTANPTFDPAAATTLPNDGTLLAALNAGWSRTQAGTAGNDTLSGIYETLVGAGGSDTYQYDVGQGQETIVNGVSGTNTALGRLLLAADLDPSKLWFSRSGNGSGADLIIQILGTTQQVTLRGWYINTYNELASLTLADGSQIGTRQITALATAMGAYQAADPGFNAQTAAALPNDAALLAALNVNWTRTITASTTGSTLNGVFGNDTLVAGSGDETLVGGTGVASYSIGAGSGRDTIVNGVATNTEASGVLQLGAGFDPSKLWLSRLGDDLVIQVLGSPRSVTVKGWFANTYAQLQTLRLADGSAIDTPAIAALEQAMSAVQAANPGFDPATMPIAPNDPTVHLLLLQDFALASAAQLQAMTGFSVPSGATKIGIATGVLGDGGPDVFIRLSNGQIQVSEFDATGTTVVASRLYTGVVDAVTTVVGTSMNMAGTGGLDLFFRDGSGRLSYWELNNAGGIVASGDVASPIGDATAVIGSGQNFAGGGGRDLFFRVGGNQLMGWEIGASGALLDDFTINYQGAAENFSPADTFLGIGRNFGGGGENDIFLRDGDGHLVGWETSASGALFDDFTINYQGVPTSFSPADTFLGIGRNFGGGGESDIFLRDGNDQFGVWETSASGALFNDFTITYQGGAVNFSVADTFLGIGRNFAGGGESDIFYCDGNDQLGVWEATASGALFDDMQFTINGAAFLVDPMATVVGVSQGSFTLSNQFGVTTTYSLVGGSGVQARMALAGSPASLNQIGSLTPSTGIAISTATDGAALVVGTSGDDVLNVGASLSTIYGNGGNDVYEFTATNQQETLDNGLSGNAGPSGELDLAFASDQLWFQQAGDDLLIDVLGTSKQADVKNWFADSATTGWEQLSKITSSDGLSLTAASSVAALIQAMAGFTSDYAASHNGVAFDPTAAANARISDPTVLAAVNANWHH